jgi:hypothetical protein
MSKFWLSDALGGADAFQAVGPISRKAKDKLEQLDAKSYSTVLKEFDVKLWVDGKLERSKEPNGVSSVRLYPKKKKVTAIIVMKEDVWKQGPDAIREFLQKTILEMFETIVEQANKQKVSLDGDALLKDVKRVLGKI